jgi:multiple sugar transport system substrate-binding protein
MGKEAGMSDDGVRTRRPGPGGGPVLGRRRFLGASAVAAAAGLLGACRSGDDDPAAGTGDLVFATFPGTEAVVQELVAAYAERTGETVVPNVLPRTGYREALVGPLTARSGTFDLIMIENSWVAEFAEAGWLAPLDDLLDETAIAQAESEIFPSSFNGVQYEDRVWGLPWDESTMYLFYRTDLLDHAPADTDDYLDAALRYTRSHSPDSPLTYGTVLQGSPERVNTQEWYNFFWSAGGELFDEGWNPTFDSDIAVETLAWRYDQLRRADVVPPDVSGFGFPEVLTALQQGQAALALQWNAAYSLLTDPEQSPDVADRMAAAPIPAASFGTRERIPFKKFWIVGVNPFSGQTAAAARFAQFFTSAEAGVQSLLLGGPTSNRAAWTDPSVAPVRGDAQLAVDAFDTGRVAPVLPEMPAVELELNRALSLVLAGEADAKDALTTAAETARRRLHRAGRLS